MTFKRVPAIYKCFQILGLRWMQEPMVKHFFCLLQGKPVRLYLMSGLKNQIQNSALQDYIHLLLEISGKIESRIWVCFAQNNTRMEVRVYGEFFKGVYSLRSERR